MKKLLCLLLVTLMLYGCGGDPVPTPETTAPPIPESFVDPTASLDGQVTFGRLVYIAPFAEVRGLVSIGDDTNIQDNVLVEGQVSLGDNVILAHNCRVTGPARVGQIGGAPCFVGFKALVEGGTVEPDAMVGIMARLGPGVTLHSGMRILAGKNVTTQQEADQVELGKVVPVSDGDRHFMEDVLLVNRDLAVGYAGLQAADPNSVRGISADPSTPIDVATFKPVLAGIPVLDPTFRNRIIGDLFSDDTVDQLSLAMGNRDSIRADEGGPFHLGHLVQMGEQVTYHALEHSELTVGDNFRVGDHTLIHGGADIGNVPKDRTRIGSNVTVGAGSVVFRSDIGDECVIGSGTLVEGCQLAPGTVVPDKTILINNQNLGSVEW